MTPRLTQVRLKRICIGGLIFLLGCIFLHRVIRLNYGRVHEIKNLDSRGRAMIAHNFGIKLPESTTFGKIALWGGKDYTILARMDDAGGRLGSILSSATPPMRDGDVGHVVLKYPAVNWWNIRESDIKRIAIGENGLSGFVLVYADGNFSLYAFLHENPTEGFPRELYDLFDD
jgi:hypothetical protein